MSTLYDENQYSHFWNTHHVNSDNFWLTGSNLHEVLHYHNIEESILIGKDVLEIGVGLGKMTHELSRVSKNVYVSDVSEVALNKVKYISSIQRLSKDIKLLPPVDLAICHLVFQHCPDSEVQRILNDVNLKENGVFSFQFADQPTEITQFVNQFIHDKNHFFRSYEKMINILESTNKKLVDVIGPVFFGHPWNFNWYFIKIKNK